MFHGQFELHFSPTTYPEGYMIKSNYVVFLYATAIRATAGLFDWAWSHLDCSFRGALLLKLGQQMKTRLRISDWIKDLAVYDSKTKTCNFLFVGFQINTGGEMILFGYQDNRIDEDYSWGFRRLSIFNIYLIAPPYEDRAWALSSRPMLTRA